MLLEVLLDQTPESLEGDELSSVVEDELVCALGADDEVEPGLVILVDDHGLARSRASLIQDAGVVGAVFFPDVANLVQERSRIHLGEECRVDLGDLRYTLSLAELLRGEADHVLEVSDTQVTAIEDSVGEVGSVEVGALQVGVGEISSDELGSDESGARQVRAFESGAGQVCVVEPSVVEAAERGVGSTEIASPEALALVASMGEVLRSGHGVLQGWKGRLVVSKILFFVNG